MNIIVRYVTSKTLRLHIAILGGLILGALYVTANLLFAIIYESVWYVAFAIYNALLLVCRYKALSISGEDGDSIAVASDVHRTLLLAAMLMSVAVVYSALTLSVPHRSEIALTTLSFYSLYGIVRILFAPFFRYSENPLLYRVMNLLRALSLLVSLYGIALQAIVLLDNTASHRDLALSLALAYISLSLLFLFLFFTKRRKK